MSSKIKVLPEKLIDQIAAGEVIERPASVVKELVENAIDAHATDIVVDLSDAGKKRIAVYDNGDGMSPEEARLSLERHATSKISRLEDLFEVKTLGFRGEALPSIASISKFTLTTRTQKAREATQIDTTGAKKIAVKVAGAPKGTEIVVEDLFFNTPARLKFLKANATEMARCSESVTQLALAYPDISFRLQHQGRKVFHYPAVKSHQARVLAVLNEKKEDFLSVDEQLEGWRVTGFVSVAKLMNSVSRWIYIYVNGRAIRDRTIMHAISAGYQNDIPRGMYPKAVLFLEAPAEEVDVNAHPTKREVRFKRIHFVHQLVEQAIKRALRNQIQKKQSARETVTAQVIEHAKESHFSFYPPDYRADYRASQMRRQVSEFPQQIPVSAPSVGSPKLGPYSRLRYIGQLNSSYLVCEDDRELILIDQHAAHERVLFEKLKQDASKTMLQPQYLLVPISLELSDDEAATVQACTEALTKLGFEIEPFGGKTFVIKAVPRTLAKKATPQLIRSIIEELRDLPKSLTGEAVMDKYLSTLACHSARTAKEKLDRVEVEALLRSMDHLKSSPHCPHGRPFSFSMPIKDIEKKFLR